MFGAVAESSFHKLLGKSLDISKALWWVSKGTGVVAVDDTKEGRIEDETLKKSFGSRLLGPAN